jgi:hypothetical protein
MRLGRFWRRSVATSFLALFPVGAAGRPVVAVPFLAVPPIIDGRLDDACWQTVPVLSHFVQVLPVEGAPPTEATEVRFARDRSHLYVAVRCSDSSPNGILAPSLQRDASFESDDVIRIALDSFHRQRDGYLFIVNPAGAQADAIFARFADTNFNWDTLWAARTRIDDTGWTAEIAIPTTSLSFDPAGATWGANVERIIRRKQETLRWSGPVRTKSVVALEDFGVLEGMTGFRQGLGLEFVPYLRAMQRSGAAVAEPNAAFDAGFDFTWRITPSLTAIGSVRPDFADAEVDGRVVNLSRFPTFFPEKRDFFLQDASLFGFGGLDESSAAYYSRRIGLGRDQRPVDIMGAARLSGRHGTTSLALLGARQAAQTEVPAKTLAVARVAQQVLEESRIGIIATVGDPRHAGDAWLAGADFGFQYSRLAGGRTLSGNAFAMVTDSDHVGARDAAFGVEIEYPNEPLSLELVVRQWGKNFEPALGFVEQVGVREFVGTGRYIWRPNTRWVRKVELEMRPLITTDLDGRIVLEDHDAPLVVFQTPSGGNLKLEYTNYREVFTEPFSMWRGHTLPAGDYRYGQFKPGFATSAARPWSVGCTFRLGNYFNGSIRSWTPTVAWRPSRHAAVSARYEYRQVHLPSGRFDVHLGSVRLNLACTPDLSWNTIAEYDNQSRRVGLNSRLRWTFRPGSDLFLVLNEGWIQDDRRLLRQFTETMAKLEMAWRF